MSSGRWLLCKLRSLAGVGGGWGGPGLGFHLGAGFGVLPPKGFASEPLPEGQGAQCTCNRSSVKSTFNWLWGGGQGGQVKEVACGGGG